MNNQKGKPWEPEPKRDKDVGQKRRRNQKTDKVCQLGQYLSPQGRGKMFRKAYIK